MITTNNSLRLVALVTGVAAALALMGALAVAPAQAAGSCPTLSRDLKQGSSGADVKSLQVFLNSMSATQIASSGAGSPGNETTYFGGLTKAAAMKFQAAQSVSPVAGYVGAKTRAAIAAVCGGTVTPGPTPGPTTGGTVTVSAGSQPVNTLAPANASRVPFTTFTLTNNSNAAVIINSVTVQRVGLGVDSNFSGIVLLDSQGLQTGTAKTLNSNHQANLDGFTLAAGASGTFTVAGNMGAETGNGGQVVALQVVAINTGATVSGTLPINGASQTMNTTLTLGSVSTSTSSYDPGAAQTKNIGDTGVRVSGVRFTAGSAEDLKFYNIRWRNTGTAAASDIGNVMTFVNDVGYPTTLSSDGKYYTTVFPGGILIPKGNNVDVYNKTDLVGTNSANRTVRLTIDKATDIYFIGQTYGYGVADTVYPSAQPWFDSYITTINAGQATTIGKATEVPAQNIAVNVNNQPLGGFITDFRGEGVSVTKMIFNFNYNSGAASTNLLTSVSVVNENGVVVAGPVDGINNAGTAQTVTFTDTVTFPTGRHIYTVKGKIPTTVANNITVVASTTPSGWTSPTGVISGSTVTISQGNFSMNTMTVKSATTSITMSTLPSSQNIVAGGNGIIFGNVQIDASQSGEDVSMSSIPLRPSAVTGLTNCRLWNGSTVLNSGSNVPSSLSAGAANVFTFDSQLIIPKGTVITLTIKCDTTTAATGAYTWSVNLADTVTAKGQTSGVSITPTITTGNAGTMSVASGSMTVVVDSSSPSYALVAAGTTGTTVGVLKLRASNEPVTLTKLGLQLTASGNSLSTASGNSTNSGVSDLVQVYIYDGSTLLGTATFTGVGTTATSTLTTPVTLPKDTDKLLTVKVDLANIGVSYGGGVGDVVKVDPMNAEGSGANSGQTIKSGATTGVAGIQMFKSYPVVTNSNVSCTNSNSCNGNAQLLKQFKIAANAAGPISLYQVAVKFATSSATVTNVKLFVYDSSCNNPVNVPANSAATTGGQFGGTWNATQQPVESATPTVSFIQGPLATAQNTANALVIPAGTTYCFQVKGDITLASATTVAWSVGVTVLGDAATTTQAIGGANVNLASSSVGRIESYSTLGIATSTGQKNFVWADNASTTPNSNTDVDWFDGYYVTGLPSGGF